ncbi:MAG: CDP-alcohol phosphatidyltransferase family protein [Myxococcota bacterium]|nr:CDP-alcohol phosphatidyltransferase family protein [Myxococcota bacterium]
MKSNPERRPLATRAQRWPHVLARALRSIHVEPDHVSAASVVVSVIAAAAWLAAARATGGLAIALWVLGAAAIQVRLLCNLLDGIVAVELGRGSALGPLWNEVPDRLSDVLVLVAAGYAISAPELGWLAATMAVLTAYVRHVGATLTGAHDFGGPLAKPQRMFVMTVAGIAAAIEVGLATSRWALFVALIVVALGSALTAVARLRRIARALRLEASR